MMAAKTTKRFYSITNRNIENIGMSNGIYSNRKNLTRALNILLAVHNKSITYAQVNKKLKNKTSFFIFTNDNENLESLEIAELNLNEICNN